MERQRVSRRGILRSGGVLAAIGAAGCVDDKSEAKPQTETGKDTDGTETHGASEIDDPPVAAEVTPEDGEIGDRFGAAIALEGSTSLVGAPGDIDATGYRVGAAYGFDRTDDEWVQRSALAPDRDGVDIEFGAAVAVDGDAALVGVPFDESGGFESGSAFVFERSDGDWHRQVTLSPDGGTSGGWFGETVALEGSTALVGAPGDGPGVAYAFERTDGAWGRSATLEPEAAKRGGRFGTAIALEGTTALVGAPGPGVAYAFERTNGGWHRRATLEPAEGDSADEFGAAVAVADDIALVGAPRREFAADGTGTAFVFERSDGDWHERAILEPDGDDRGFGTAVAVDDGIALVGAPTERSNSDGTGAAQAFERRDGTWHRRAILAPETPDSKTGFGKTVALEGTTALVGAPDDGPGVAYAFEL
ncbi:FG-GAP repeat protein [Halopiger djelfimassiliensis]|uniref:FG-GAP repeat protein n=1 Tax=Halopiger djelfimassiliensis TaxID=1293047 RepID=UPI00067763AD|nr:FG-GAP repeat protein [Halopiger djelfimassiliensis]